MKWVLYILGGLFTLAGVVWILQGLNVLPGSMMSGHLQYAGLGLVVGAIGVALILLGNRRARSSGR